MKVSDLELLRQVISHKSDLYLHKDTLDKLDDIKKELEEDVTKSFRAKSITTKIINAWTYILQDSIYNLKCYDSRENAYVTKKSNWRTENLDLNNQFVFGLDRLQNYFIEFTEFESVLYGVDGNYRDHIVHVFRVWLLGVSLLYSNDPCLAMSIEDLEFDSLIKGKPSIREQEVFSMWAIIALCHDLGYPLEKAEKVNESVEKMYRHLGKISIQKFSAAFQLEHQFLNKFLLEFISSKLECNKEKQEEIALYNDIESKYNDYFDGNLHQDEVNKFFIQPKLYHTAVQTKYFVKFAKSLEYYSHGIISCTILLKSLFFFLESDFNIQERTRLSFEDARQFFIRREIFRSIAAHTCPEVYHLKANTLPFLLILCDELQEWGRPRFDDLKAGSESKSVFETDIAEFKTDKIKFTSKYSAVGDPERLAKKIFR
ncbi:MAG: hypothetical protein ACYCYE_18805, partial [Clostridia bacterium]